MTTRRPTARARRIRLTTALALLLTLTQVAALPASADHPAIASARGGCGRSFGEVTPYGQVYMRENGKSGVTRFRARFRLYLNDVTAGWTHPAREKTYYSPTFPNDAKNYQDNLPRGAYHQWTVYDDSYRMDAKITYERPWRPDWNSTVQVARC